MRLIRLGKLKQNFIHSTSTTHVKWCSQQVMSPFVVEAFVLFLYFYKDKKHMHLATIWSVLIKCLTWKENLEGDGQRFHQKTNDHFSHQITEHEKGHGIWTYDVLKPGPGLGQA